MDQQLHTTYHLYLYFFFQRPSSPMTMICCPLLSKIDVCDRWLSHCFNIPEVTVYLTTTALFPGPLAPGLYLLFSLTVMKPAFKEWDAGSEASQIRSVERLAGWAWWMRARMSFCCGCIVNSFHCHPWAYESVMTKGASVRSTLPLLLFLFF